MFDNKSYVACTKNKTGRRLLKAEGVRKELTDFIKGKIIKFDYYESTDFRYRKRKKQKQRDK